MQNSKFKTFSVFFSGQFNNFLKTQIVTIFQCPIQHRLLGYTEVGHLWHNGNFILYKFMSVNSKRFNGLGYVTRWDTNNN